MIIFGIDPGYAIIGYGIINFEKSVYFPKDYGAIYTTSDINFPSRLELIFDRICELIKVHHPDYMAIEKLYFQNNHKTAISVAEARGVILLAGKKFNVEIFEYTPLQIKNAVTGYGKASKIQVMNMTKLLLRLDTVPKPDDVADALAIAICHANSQGAQYINKNISKYHTMPADR